jgi:dihydroflavonol-4-reductase
MLDEKLHVLVTGATGFIGWHTAARLRAAGHRVRALVRDRAKGSRLLGPLGIEDADLVIGDMTDPAAVAQALDGCSAALHAAAAVSVTAHGAAFEDNVEGTRLVVGGACERGFESVVFVSSLTAIFDSRAKETSARSPLAKSATRYGRSKAESDAFVRSLEAGGAPVAIVYPSGIIGPNDPGRSESMRAYRGFTQTMIDCEGGTQFVDVRDLAWLFECLLEARRAGRFVAAGDFFTWRELMECIEEVTGARIRCISAPGWLLRAGGRAADGLSRLSGKTLPFSREGMEVATRWHPIADSPEIRELGVHWREPRETLADVYSWFVESGGIPARALPKLPLAAKDA